MEKIKSKKNRDVYLLLSGYLLLLVILLIGVIVFNYYNLPVNWITQSPSTSQQFIPIIGYVSNLGVLLWSFTAAICFFAAFIQLHNGNRIEFWFLFLSGFLTFILLVDDFFEIREMLGAILNVPGVGVYLGYIIFTGVLFFYFRRLIFTLEYKFLILSCIFMFLSIFADTFFNELPQIYEDGFKFFGIFTWFFFFIRASYQFIARGKMSTL